MNFTTPNAPDDISVLRARQLEATKRRVIAEFQSHGIVRAMLQYRAEPFGDGEVNVNGMDAELHDGSTVILEHPIEAAFYDIATLFKRLALDAVAHKHPRFAGEAGGFGHVILHADKGAVHIRHTDYKTREMSTAADL